MKRVLLIRYGEIGLKGRNRKVFEDKLQHNIKKSLEFANLYLNARISKSQGRFYVENFEPQLESRCIEVLSCVPGIVAINPAALVENNFETIKTAVVSIMREALTSFISPVTFKIDARRADKSFPFTSPEINQDLGAVVLENISGLRVNLHKPAIHLKVEVRKGSTYIYYQQINGPGGLPVGTSGKGILLISGGIDSPVAGYMAMKRGVDLNALHFWSYPITSRRARDKVIDICATLRNYNPDLRLFIAPFTKIQTEIMDKCPERHRITVMRRMMMRVASRICENIGGLAIFTGENLGQVASQTIESLKVIEKASDFPVLRPLICFDKVEIIGLARQIDTYDISILPYEDCCSVFVPKHPATKPRLHAVLDAEKQIDVVRLVDECLAGVDVFDLNSSVL